METPAKQPQEETTPNDKLSWLAVSGTIFAALGSVATFGWLYTSGRGWSSIPAYFDPWHPSAIVATLLAVGIGLTSLVSVRENETGGAWIIASQWTYRISLGAAIWLVIVVPIVIWVVKLLIWVAIVLMVAVGLLVLYNVDRLCRGQRMYWPRSPWGFLPWIRKALNLVPFKGLPKATKRLRL